MPTYAMERVDLNNIIGFMLLCIVICKSSIIPQRRFRTQCKMYQIQIMVTHFNC